MAAEQSSHILVAEDNPALRAVIRFALQKAGFRVTAAENGQVAWHALNSESIDLVVSDFQMPGLTGGELCERMRSHGRHAQTPMIFLTAKGLELDVDHYRDDLAVSAVFSKPFSPRELAESVHHFLAEATSTL